MDSVLCSANAQSMKYYYNEDEFGILPEEVKNTLKAILTGYCADVGGVIVLSFNDEYELAIQAIDPIDEIGSELLIKRIQIRYAELFEKLELFYREADKLKKG